MQSETFWTLLRDRAHWEFELFLMVLFDGVVGALLWPFIKRHWDHHLSRDLDDTLSSYGLRRLPGAVATSWWPVDSAPRDGSKILTYGPTGIEVSVWWEKGFFDPCNEYERDGVTHWMDLPKAP